MGDREEKKVYHTLNDEQPITKTMVTGSGKLIQDDEPQTRPPAPGKIYDVEPTDLRPSLKEKMASDRVLNQPLANADKPIDEEVASADQRAFTFDFPLADKADEQSPKPAAAGNAHQDHAPEPQGEEIVRRKLEPAESAPPWTGRSTRTG